MNNSGSRRNNSAGIPQRNRWTASMIGILGGCVIALTAILSVAAWGMGLDFGDGDDSGCTWGGTSTVPPPSAIYLRSYQDFFHSPARIAIDGWGNVYTTDPGTGKILVRDPYGRLTAGWKGFDIPLSIAVDGVGRIYIGEQGRGRIAVFDQERNLLFQLGQGDAEFLFPNDIAIDPNNGRVYVCDSGAHAIKVYDSSDGAFQFSFGGKGTATGNFDFPAAIHISDIGEVFVADQNNDRVQVFDEDGTFSRCFGKSGEFGRIQGITGDSQGRLYVADAFQGYIQVFDNEGVLLTTISSFGRGPGRLRTPMGLAIDPYNRLFIASTNNARIEVFGLDDFVDPIPIISAVVDIKPDTLNMSGKRKFVTAYIEIQGYPLENVDLATVSSNGVSAELWPWAVGDYDGDGIPDLKVKFDGQALLGTLSEGQASITVTGEFLDGTLFEGSDSVRIIQKKDRKKRRHRGKNIGKRRRGKRRK